MTVIAEEPQLSLPLTSGLEVHESCTAGSLHVWPIKGDLGGWGPMENEHGAFEAYGAW